MSAGEFAVDVRNLSFWYPDETRALNNVSLHIRRGEVVTIMGANGAGKTTLCMILTGIIPSIIQGKLEGSAKIHGKEVSQTPISDLSQIVSIVLQDPESQLITPTVDMECCFGPANLGVPAEQIRARAKRALDIVRLSGMERRSPKDLSGGQKQRLAIAATLTMMPKILVLDEPTSQLDPIGTEEVLTLVAELKKLGMTIVLAEHKSEEILPVSDRVVVLKDGAIVDEGNVHDIFANRSLMKSCGVKIPQVADIAYQLKSKGFVNYKEIPLTLDELVPLVKDKYVNVELSENKETQPLNPAEELLAVSSLTFTYPSIPPVQALRGVSLRVGKREFVAIIGQNGSGKSTLARIMSGLLEPTSGVVRFKGRDIREMTRKEIASRIGMIFQNPDHQIFTQTVEREVEFGLRNLGLGEDEIKKRTDEVLMLTGLSGVRERFPFSLSIGDRRKLTVAAVVAMRPEVIILDEPTTGQDNDGRRSILELCRELNKKGHTILLITHDMELVAKYSRRVVVMANGSISLDAPVREAMYRSEELKKTFLKPPQVIQLVHALSPATKEGPVSVDEFVEMVR